ncbi:tetratricopeptide repeat protein [Thalassotalea ponticola]|uniref:tetratricopeptide repeat protein n=1 Tax=Thalassotalea ponticola TaxID=1523392 RepID=UPI0025B5A877|nr:tetratricopeptide repeat protein [Thalassotalea ponticola]MDN3652600.1 tetratricopeptide repeat protein [Thalassotalea ponticola]
MIRPLCLLILWFTLAFYATFQAVAEQQCVSCHKTQVEQWQSSHHYHAMGKASLTKVLGNFDNQTLEYQQQVVRFFSKDQQLIIAMPDLTGKLTEYPVLYSFGYYPLQQYMFDMGNGHIQLFPFAWDSRSKEQGGQRWFVLHPEQQPHDLFHWSQKGQNWNHMCADCHSTEFKKHYDINNNSFDSTYRNINVSCQACHGDATEHVTWAQGDQRSVDKGFKVSLKAKTSAFLRQPDGSLVSAEPLVNSEQVQVCATCHARRSQLADRTQPDQFFEQFRAALLTPEYYHVDGQIWDENYVWGSFLQSKMYNKGVTCTNCHNPHSGDLKLAGNTTCTQCHDAPLYDTPIHHGHKPESKGSQCVDCHMPATTYMKVDARRDHSFRVPRPDLTIKTKAPNACNSCHDDKTAQWAVDSIKQWHPASKYMAQEHFSLAFHASDNRMPNASAMLTQIVQDQRAPDIVRASALNRLVTSADKNAIIAITRAIKDTEPLKRQAAIFAAQAFDIQHRWRMINSLLDDNLLAVRAEAARVLSPMLLENEANSLSEHDITRLNKALEEYKSIQKYQAERGFSHTNLGNLALALNQQEQAKQHYLKAIEIEPIYIPAYINLADLYRRQADEGAAQQVLRRGLKVDSTNSDLNYALAMGLIRQQQKSQALEYLARASKYANDNPRFHYAYALLLQDMGDLSRALNAFYQAFKLSPNNPDISYSLTQTHLALRQYDQALKYANHLSTLVPNNRQIEHLIEQIKLMSTNH